MTERKKVPGSSRHGEIDTRSSDAKGKQADEVTPHAERAAQRPPDTPAPKEKGEAPGALRDQTAR